MLPLAMDFAFFDPLFALALFLWISLSFAIRYKLHRHGCYFASRQLSPIPTSTNNGTSSR
jgi:hypothetical protein